MRKESKEFLYKYLNASSPVGFESAGQKVWLEYMKPYIDDYTIDAYGSVVGIINPKAKYKVVIEAHADEIAWFVNYIDDKGYIYVRRNGGSDALIAPSMRVNLHTKKGMVKGIFGWPAIHVRADKDRDPKPELKNIFIDIGASSKKEVLEMGVDVGTVATFVDELTELNDKYFVGRALDNRMGGFMIAEVARMLKENKKKLPFGLYIANCVQEEIGLRGAEMIARRIKPDIAIITDVTHDSTTPMINKITQGECSCGKGPALTYGPAVHNKLLDLVQKVAEKNKIPVQLSTVSRSTGTDTDSFAYANDGCPSVLISIPLRYMHTTVEMLNRNDIEDTIKLMYQTLLALTPKTNLSYF